MDRLDHPPPVPGPGTVRRSRPVPLTRRCCPRARPRRPDPGGPVVAGRGPRPANSPDQPHDDQGDHHHHHRHQGGGVAPDDQDQEAQGQDRPLQGLAVPGHEVVDGPAGGPPRLPQVTDLGPDPGVAGDQGHDGDHGGQDEDEPDGVAQVGGHRVDDGGGRLGRLRWLEPGQVLVAAHGDDHQDQPHGQGQADAGPHQSAPTVAGQHHGPGEAQQGDDGEHHGQLVEELDQLLDADQVVGLEQHVVEALDRRHLVEDGDPLGRQLLLDRDLHLAQVDGDLAVLGADRAGLGAGQHGHQLLVGGPVGRHPQLLELGRLHQLEGDRVGGLLHLVGDGRDQESGLGRQGVLDPLPDRSVRAMSSWLTRVATWVWMAGLVANGATVLT